MRSKKRIQPQNIEEFNAELELTHQAKILTGVGNPVANVVVVGLAAVPGEKMAFTMGANKLVFDVMVACGIRSEAIYLTYMIKTPTRQRSPSTLKHWGRILGEELAMLKPKAVLFLGRDVFKWFTTIDNSIDKLRGTRFGYESFPETNMFVSYSPDDVVADGGLNEEKGRLLIQDLIAVLRVQADHFPLMVTLPPTINVPLLRASLGV